MRFFICASACGSVAIHNPFPYRHLRLSIANFHFRFGFYSRVCAQSCECREPNLVLLSHPTRRKQSPELRLSRSQSRKRSGGKPVHMGERSATCHTLPSLRLTKSYACACFGMMFRWRVEKRIVFRIFSISSKLVLIQQVCQNTGMERNMEIIQTHHLSTC